MFFLCSENTVFRLFGRTSLAKNSIQKPGTIRVLAVEISKKRFNSNIQFVFCFKAFNGGGYKILLYFGILHGTVPLTLATMKFQNFTL